MRLPVRVRPIKGESFIGYMLRVAKTNGRGTHKELLNTVGAPTRLKKMLSDINEVCVVSGAIEPWLLMEPGTLLSHFQEQYSASWLYKENRSIRNIRVLQPRLCPHCVSAEGGYFKHDWSLLPVTHCNEHSCELVDACPSCGKPLKWHAGLFEGCNECGYSWRESSYTKAEIPSWQTKFLSSTNDQVAINRYLEDLTEHVVMAARPYDYIHEDIDVLHESVTNIGGLIAQAFNDSQDKTEWPPKGFVKARRLKHAGSLRNHCQHEHIAAALGFKPGDKFSALVEKGIIKPIHSTPVLRDMLFDIRDAEVLIDKQERSQSVPDGHESVNSDSKLLGRYDTSYGELVAAGLEDIVLNIPYEASDLSIVQVPTEWLFSFLRENLVMNCVGDIPLYRAKKILGVSEQELGQLVIAKQLVAGRDKTTTRAFTAESILRISTSNNN